MTNTIRSVCDAFSDKLCKVPVQDFTAAAIVRDVQRAVDPKGTKRLNPNQVKSTKTFLRILVKTAYS